MGRESKREDNCEEKLERTTPCTGRRLPSVGTPGTDCQESSQVSQRSASARRRRLTAPGTSKATEAESSPPPALSQPPRDSTRAPQPLRAGGQGPGLETRPSDPSACPADNTPASPSALPSRHHVTAHGQRYPHRQGHAWGSLIKACLSLPSCLPHGQLPSPSRGFRV